MNDSIHKCGVDENTVREQLFDGQFLFAKQLIHWLVFDNTFAQSSFMKQGFSQDPEAYSDDEDDD